MPFIPKHEIVDSLHSITQSLSSKELEPLYKSNNVEQYNIGRRVETAYFKLNQLEDWVYYDFPVLPRELQDDWKTFRKREDLTPSQSTKIAFGVLVKKTLQVLEYIKSLQRSKQSSLFNVLTPSLKSEDRKNVRIINREQIDSDIRRLGGMYSEATKQLDEVKKKGNAKEEEIKKLNDIIKNYEEKIFELRTERDASENDFISEQKLEDRLTRSFNELNKKKSGLDYEVLVARIEYWVCIVIMTLITVCFLYWYQGFYKELLAKCSRIHITTWISYLPFALPLTVYIVLMWMLVVQKNRASKISVSLSTRLANVQYLEGLMRLVNRLSLDSGTAIERINVIVGKMIDSYIRQLETTNVTENKIERIEEKEQKDVPQQRIFNELKKQLHYE